MSANQYMPCGSFASRVGTWATVNGTNYAGLVTFGGGQNGGTGYAHAENRVIVNNGSKYYVAFDHWTFDYDGPYTNWQSRVTESGNDVTINNSYEQDPTSANSTGTLTFVSYWTATLLSPSDPHYDDDVKYVVSVATDPSDGSGGTASGGGLYAAGSSCTITATPADGYRFVHWTGGQAVSTTSHTFAVTSDITWTAHFERKRVWVLAGSSPGLSGSIYVNPYSHPYSLQECNYGASGDSVRLLATAGSGWRFLRWTGPGGYTSTSADVTIALSDSYVDANKVYSSSLRDYTITFTAEFEPTAYNTIKVRILEGAEYGTVQRILYWTPNKNSSTSNDQYVTVIKDTSSEYEVRVPVSYFPEMAKSVTGPTEGGYTYTTPLLAPNMTRNRHVYKYLVTLDGVTETYEAPPRKDPVPPMYDWALGYFDENSYDEMELLWQRVEGLCPYDAQETGTGATLTVDFYLKRIATENILCTGAGKILCNSARKLMFDG